MSQPLYALGCPFNIFSHIFEDRRGILDKTKLADYQLFKVRFNAFCVYAKKIAPSSSS